MIRIAVLIGSARPHANTAKAMAVVVKALAELEDVAVEVIDPRTMDLPLPGPTANQPAVDTISRSLQSTLRSADGVVMITPEYDGTISAVMKLLIEYLGYPSVLAGKPVALIGIAGGRIGAHRALEHLRAIATHIGCYVVPESVSVGAAYSQFDPSGSCLDPTTEKALTDAAETLVRYARPVPQPAAVP